MYSVIEAHLDNLFDKNHPLRQISKDVELANLSSYHKLITEMYEAMIASGHATGISAIQFGVPLRIFIVNMSLKNGEEIVAINPQVITISGRFQERAEGCLSLPNYCGKVKRRNKISFSAFALNGEKCVYHRQGYEAAVIQHEFDHLDGILYWDRMDEPKIPIKRQERE
jgi:peptide deformylase